ncbi:hypothetical protein VAE122_2970040 [Vibrio aestuarianus]|nr:hypothetical protein VAE122_2970040 [Vibrio aestuarianus]
MLALSYCRLLIQMQSCETTLNNSGLLTMAIALFIPKQLEVAGRRQVSSSP